MTATFAVYLLLGFALGIYFDRGEMKKHVPYGEYPSGFPLWTMRLGFVTVCMMFGVGLLPACFAYALWKGVREEESD